MENLLDYKSNYFIHEHPETIEFYIKEPSEYEIFLLNFIKHTAFRIEFFE